MYRLMAFDRDHRVVFENVEESKGAAYIGFDIWRDGSLEDKELRTDLWRTIDLLDDETGEVLLSGRVIRIDRETAVKLMMNWGWNRRGAEEIVVKGYMDGVLGDEDDLRQLADEYASR